MLQLHWPDPVRRHLLGFRRVLLIGHIGKLVKLGAGIMNTPSAQGDARMEILVSCALARGASLEALRAVAACITTEAALEELRRFWPWRKP